MTDGVDYAWGHPGGAALQAAGMQFAARYLSHDQSKSISRAEADDLAAHGVWSVVVFEDAAQRPLSGRAAGVADAQLASAQAIAAGMPDGRPIYFALDFDVTPQQQAAVNAYLDGAGSVLGGAARVGVYGGYYTVKRALDAGVAAWAWQTIGWSGGQWEPRAVLRQPGGTVTLGGVDCDTDTATADDYGQWMPGKTPTSTPPPEDIVTPQDIKDIAAAVWNYGVPDWGLDSQGKAAPLGTSKEAYWHLVWGDVYAGQQTAMMWQILAAAQASKLTPAEIAQALADGTLKVSVSIAPAVAPAASTGQASG